MQGFGGGPVMGDQGSLDEPVAETIMRDLRMVGSKMMCVLNPRKANIQTLKDWDLWGPLILCLMLATLLSWFAPYEQASLVFASVFVIIWVGAAVVTVNALLLGGNISFFQSVCGEHAGFKDEATGALSRPRQEYPLYLMWPPHRLTAAAPLCRPCPLQSLAIVSSRSTLPP